MLNYMCKKCQSVKSSDLNYMIYHLEVKHEIKGLLRGTPKAATLRKKLEKYYTKIENNT